MTAATMTDEGSIFGLGVPRGNGTGAHFRSGNIDYPASIRMHLSKHVAATQCNADPAMPVCLSVCVCL